jgi:ribosome-interacting GTPase 1
MKTIISAALITLVAGSAAFASVQPIPGSITYDNANVQMEKAPAGSTFFHTFANGDGRDVREVYKVNADKSVTLVDRQISNAS